MTDPVPHRFTFGCLLAGIIGLTAGQGHWPVPLALIAGIAMWVEFSRCTRPAMLIPALTVSHVLVWESSYAGMIPLPLFTRLGMETAISLVLAILFLTHRAAGSITRSLTATLVLPCGWAAFDLLSARFSPGGTWASIAYTLADSVICAQIASLVGWTGVTFLTVWIATAVAWVASRAPDESLLRRRGLITLSAVLVSVYGFGIARLSFAPSGEPVRFACVVAPDTFTDESLNDVYAYTRGIDVPESSTTRARARIARSLEELFHLVDTAAAADPQWILWPEANAVLTQTEEAAWIERARTAAESHDAFIGMGLIVFRPGTGQGTLNKFVVVAPDGEVRTDYLKATRVPGSLNTTGDGRLPVIEAACGRVSTAICFDLDFPQLISQAGRNRIDLLLAPSNDWVEAEATHARMARLRAIEQGFALVRPTKDGTTLLTDSSGRTVATMKLADDRTGLLVGDLIVRRRFTLYSAIGDAFPFLCAAGFVVIAGVLLRFRWRRDSEPDESAEIRS